MAFDPVEDDLESPDPEPELAPVFLEADGDGMLIEKFVVSRQFWLGLPEHNCQDEGSRVE